MRRFLFLFSALLFSAVLVFSPGCGGDDDENPAGPGNGDDTLTTAEVLEQLDEFSDEFSTTYEECEAAYMLAGLTVMQNTNELAFLMEVIGYASENDGDLSSYYGTWEDTTDLFIPPRGLERISGNPAAAVAVKLVGVDALGNPVPGDFTIREFLVQGDSDTLRIDVATHVDGSSDSMAVRVIGDMDMDSGTGSFKVWADACGISAFVDVAIDGDTEVATISGWYDYADDPTLYFEFTGTIGEDDQGETEAEGTIHVWTTQAPTFDMVVVLTSDPDTCVTGTIKLSGVEEAQILVVNCDAETADVYIVIDGQNYDAEEFLDNFYEIIFGFDPGFLEDMLGKEPEPAWLWPFGERRPQAVERLR